MTTTNATIANDLTFGIEIECHIPREVYDRENIVRGGYHNGRVCDALDGWSIQSDSSIRVRGNRVAIEVVSPVLKGRDGIESILRVLAKLKEWRARVNKSCGLHIHVGVADVIAARDHRTILNLVYLTAKFERALYAVSGSKARSHAHYARPLNRVFEQLKTASSWDDLTARANRVGRYHSLNLTNLRSSRLPTVEFRAFAGTTNVTKILGYLQVCLGLVENAKEMKRRPTKACRNTAQHPGRAVDPTGVRRNHDLDLHAGGRPCSSEAGAAGETSDAPCRPPARGVLRQVGRYSSAPCSSRYCSQSEPRTCIRPPT